MSRLRAVAVAVIFALAAAGLVACGGGGGGSGENPQAVIDQAFANKITSGVMKADFNLTAKGSQSGTLKATLSGPFQTKANQSDVDLKAAVAFNGGGQDFNFDGGLISSGGKVYVNYQGADYALGGSQVKQAKQTAKTGNLSVLKGSLTDLKNDGHENVAGVDTIHITGTVDPGKLADSFKQALQSAGSKLPGAAAPTQQQIDQLKNSVKDAHFDLFVGADDKIVRKFAGTLAIDGSAAGGSGSGAVDFAVEFDDVGKPQTVSAPKNAKPISQLLGKIGLGGLGGLGGASGGAGGSSSGAPSGASSQAYLDCLKKAKDQSAIAACASKIK